MIGEGSIWHKAMEDDSLLVVECKQALNKQQADHLKRSLDEALEGTGKRVIVLEAGIRLAPPDGPVFLHVEMAGPGQPLRVFDQFGRELAGVRVVNVTDAENGDRVLQLELEDMPGEGDANNA